MAGLTLVIANRNYSSWSLRAWVLLRELGIAFDEVMLPFHSPAWEAGIARWSPSGLVPVLWRGEVAVWDTLAIVESVNEWYPAAGVWPADPVARAFARSACAEMHAGFRQLRQRMPMNIRASLPGRGMDDAVRAEIDRLEGLWGEARRRFGSGGPFLFGRFTAADAMFAPVVLRLATYGVAVGEEASRYAEAVRATAGVRAWVAAALAETAFVAEDEPYAGTPPGEAAPP